MSARPLSVQFSDDTTFSTGDAIQHLAWHHSVSPEGYVVLDRAGLEERLPHRGPALRIDYGFVPLGENFRYTFGVSYIAADSPELEGHFPEAQVLPGHLILEKMGLACALVPGLVPQNLHRDDRVYLPLFRGTREFSIERQVLPKSILIVRAELLREETGTKWKCPVFSARAFVNGVQCAEAIILAKIDSSRRR